MPITIIFSGLCAFVPDNNEKPSKMRVAMADATPRGAQSGKPLLDLKVHRNHFPVLRFRAGDLADYGSLAPDLGLQASIYRRIVSFEPDTADPLTVKGWARPSKLILDGEFKNTDYFGWGPAMAAILDDRSAISPLVFDSAKSKGRVSTLVDLHYGSLRSAKPLPAPDLLWSSPALFGGDAYVRQPMSGRAELVLPNTTSLTIRITGMDGEAEVTIKLKSKDNSEVAVEIGNLCGDSLSRVAESLPYKFTGGSIDDDFLWHYELCERRADLQAIMLEYPRPHPLSPWIASKSGDGGDLQVQCMRTIFPAVPY